MLHKVKGIKQKCIPLALLNLAEDESIFLKKGEILGHLEPSSTEIGEIMKEDWSNQVESDEEEEENTKIPFEKKFITSPAEVNTHRKVNLQDAEVLVKYRKQFKLLCDIDTGDGPPVCQKPYNLPLKHREWVQKELETLEKAGVIVRSISPGLLQL